MKIQDLVFFCALIFLILLKRPRFMVASGMISLFLALPLFALWIFFTAERLVMYAAGFFFAAVLFECMNKRKNGGIV